MVRFVWYIDSVAAFPEIRRKLGQFIGVATDTGAAVTFSILPTPCKPIARPLVQALTDEEKTQPAIRLVMAAFDSIRAMIGDQIAQADFNPIIADFAPEPYAFDLEDGDNDMQWEPVQLDHVRDDLDTFALDQLDEYMTACVLLPRGGNQERGWARRRV